MSFNWKKVLWIDRRLPRTSYVLRTFVGFYLIYIIYQVIGGLNDPEVTNPAFVIISTIVLSVFCIFCILSGALGLYKKEYREMYDDEEEVTEQKKDEIDEIDEDNIEKVTTKDTKKDENKNN